MQIEQIGFDVPLPKHHHVRWIDFPHRMIRQAFQGLDIQSAQEFEYVQAFEEKFDLHGYFPNKPFLTEYTVMPMNSRIATSFNNPPHMRRMCKFA